MRACSCWRDCSDTAFAHSVTWGEEGQGLGSALRFALSRSSAGSLEHCTHRPAEHCWLLDSRGCVHVELSDMTAHAVPSIIAKVAQWCAGNVSAHHSMVIIEPPKLILTYVFKNGLRLLRREALTKQNTKYVNARVHEYVQQHEVP